MQNGEGSFSGNVLAVAIVVVAYILQGYSTNKLNDTRGKHVIKEGSEMRLAIVKEITVILNREGDNRES